VAATYAATACRTVEGERAAQRARDVAAFCVGLCTACVVGAVAVVVLRGVPSSLFSSLSSSSGSELHVGSSSGRSRDGINDAKSSSLLEAGRSSLLLLDHDGDNDVDGSDLIGLAVAHFDQDGDGDFDGADFAVGVERRHGTSIREESLVAYGLMLPVRVILSVLRTVVSIVGTGLQVFLVVSGAVGSLATVTGAGKGALERAVERAVEKTKSTLDFSSVIPQEGNWFERLCLTLLLGPIIFCVWAILLPFAPCILLGYVAFELFVMVLTLSPYVALLAGILFAAPPEMRAVAINVLWWLGVLLWFFQAVFLFCS
jgi:hypothetical protein